uniref:Aminoacyl-tRNA synthetase class Ia domain-containing protein n=1 Tax=Romanomermis culicivorax TaxID=13658 RepID=A0A915I2B8_ROMCU
MDPELHPQCFSVKLAFGDITVLSSNEFPEVAFCNVENTFSVFRGLIRLPCGRSSLMDEVGSANTLLPRSLKFNLNLGDEETKLVVSKFKTSTFLFISNTGKVGAVLKIERVIPAGILSARIDSKIQILQGELDSVNEERLAIEIFKVAKVPVLHLGLMLPDLSKDNIDRIIIFIKNNDLDLSIHERSKIDELYEHQLENKKNRNYYVILDGPPYANGDVHVGHAVNKILKDVVLRYKAMTGYRVHFRPGWDCHGLPIELKCAKEQQQMSQPSEIRRVCKSVYNIFQKQLNILSKGSH